MMPKLLHFLLLSFVSISSVAQTRIDTLYSAIISNDADKAFAIISRIESEGINRIGEENLCDFLYLKGVYLEKSGKGTDAQNCYKESIEIAQALRRFDHSFFDAVLRVMMYTDEKALYYDCVYYGMIGINTPMSNQKEYPAMYHIYTVLASAMLKANMYADIPNVSNKGGQIVKEQLDSSKDEYYALPFSEVSAWILMDNIHKAYETFSNLNCERANMSRLMTKHLDALHDELKHHDELADKKENLVLKIDSLRNNLIFQDVTTVKGSVILNNYFSLVRDVLESYHYDTTNPKDEECWSKLISNMLIHFYVQCDSMTGREAVEYNNILCVKNFLHYHYGSHLKKPSRWNDIQNILDDNEIAIEISDIPEDILIITKNVSHPICIRIDSLLFEQIASYNRKDPLSIAEYYSSNGPLTKLWKLIETEIGDNVRTVYISGSSLFAEINYGAISIGDQFVSDKYDIHNMLSTLDIAGIKRKKEKKYRSACLIGGVDYNVAQQQGVIYEDAQWNLSQALSDNLRRRFRFLPNTLKHVVDLGNLMDSIGVAHTIRTGQVATEEFIKSMNGESPDIIHIATHGFMLAPLFNDTTAINLKAKLGTQYQTILSQSGLLMSGANKKWYKDMESTTNDGILTSKEIANMDLSKTNLAILMACKSGLGGTNHTGIPFGVAYAFRMAGVDRILCCLWDVDEEATSQMMSIFYKKLAEIDDVNEALKQSQKMMINQGYESPFYWAPYILIE